MTNELRLINIISNHISNFHILFYLSVTVILITVGITMFISNKTIKQYFPLIFCLFTLSWVVGLYSYTQKKVYTKTKEYIQKAEMQPTIKQINEELYNYQQMKNIQNNHHVMPSEKYHNLTKIIIMQCNKENNERFITCSQNELLKHLINQANQ